MTQGLIIPALVIAIAAFFMPRLLARFLAEGVPALLINGFVSTVLMFVVSGLVFFGLYVWEGAAAAVLLGEGAVANAIFFGRLGLSAALIWAPILVLSLAGLPQKWVRATW